MSVKSHVDAARGVFSLCLALFLATACASVEERVQPAPAPAARAEQPVQPGSEDLSFFVGRWDIHVLRADGTVAYRAETRGQRILDGHAIRDDWRAFDAQGRVMYRGTSLRCYLPLQDQWSIHWVPADHPGYTYLDARWEDGELRAEGHGVEGGREFLERLKYFGITQQDYELIIERSYDGGASWLVSTHLVARRASDVAE